MPAKDTFKMDAQEIYFPNRGKGIAAADVLNAIEFVHGEINRFNPQLEIVSVMDFGAVGDGVTDDTEAIQNAANEAGEKHNALLFFPSCEGYLTTNTIHIPRGVDVTMNAPVIYAGPLGTVALEVGDNENPNSNRTYINMAVRRHTNFRSDWENDGDIGILFHRNNTSKIHIRWVQYFTQGVVFSGSGGGFAYNHIELGALISNKIGVRVTNTNNGWANENIFINGRFGQFTGFQAGKSRYGIVVDSMDETYLNNNNNNFYKPSFELGPDAIPIHVIHGNQNAFYDCRNEGNGPTFAKYGANGHFNIVTTGYGSASQDESETKYPSNHSMSRRRVIPERPNSWNTGSIVAKINPYDNESGGRIYLPPPLVGVSPGGNLYHYITFDHDTDFESGFLVLSWGGIGVWLDTSICKRFVFTRGVKPDRGGRLRIACFDENGERLTGSDPRYVSGPPNTSGHYSTGHGGVYAEGADNTNGVYRVFRDEVKKALVFFTAGTEKLHIASFGIIAMEKGLSPSILGNSVEKPMLPMATEPPNWGKWPKGTVLFNLNATAGAPLGWRCVESGSPGTWETLYIAPLSM